MKYCPQCQSQYTDDTLRFCLQDGATLTDDVKQSSIDTIAFSNPMTVEKLMQTEELRVQLPDRTQNRFEPPVAPAVQTQTSPSKSSGMFWVAVLPMLVVLSAAGFGGWFYLKNQSQTANDKSPAPVNTENKISANSSTTATEKVTEKTHQPPSTNEDNGEVKKEIASFINLWKESFESRNIAEYTSKYAETVDYNEKEGTNIKEIRNEIQKVFNSYKEIEVTLTNIRVAVDGDKDKATAIFDKEWSYETEKDLTDGKAHTKLHFQKIGNEWKIVSERILKTYYVEN